MSRWLPFDTTSARARRLGVKLSLSLVAVALSLAAAEGTLVLIGRQSPRPYWHVGEQSAAMNEQTNALVGWTMGPNRVSSTDWSTEFDVTYRSNHSGFRTGNHPANDRGSGFRVSLQNIIPVK